LASVSVTIAAYNNRDIISDCLNSVLRQSRPVHEVVLVDNASTDGTADFVAVNFPDVRVIRNTSNELFSPAQNRAIAGTGGEYVLMLNSDAVLDEGFVAAAVDAMESDPVVGSVSGRVLRAGGGVIDTTGLTLGRDRRPVERGYGEPDDGRYSEGGYVFGAGGVCPLYRRTMLEDVKLADGEYLDGTYGAFYEDLDLAWRANIRGWKAIYEPGAVAYHVRGATARTKRPRAGFLARFGLARLPVGLRARVAANRWLTIVKDDTPGGFVINLPFILLYELRLWAYFMVFSPSALPEVFRLLRDGLVRAWRLRKKIHAA